MKRIYTLIAALTLVIGTLTGCTPSDSTSTGTGTTTTGTDTNTTAVSTNK